MSNFFTLKRPRSLKGKSLYSATRRVPQGQAFFLLIPALVLSFAPQTSAQASKTAKPSRPYANIQSCGPLFDNVLKCPRFGFTYKVTYGWVDRTGDIQEDADASQKDQPNKPGTSQTLLAVFERPPGAPGDTINSAVVIAAESLADYHGIKQAADYFGPITELAQQRGFKVVNEPSAYNLGTKQLVRGDFSKERGKLTMVQTSLVMIEKGYIVSFTFVGGSEDEVEDLVQELTFGMPKPRR